jgi:isocitrate lyase
MLTQMAKYLDTVYVSGWQCSSTASSTHEPSPDLADYPMVCSGTSNLVVVLTLSRTLYPNKFKGSSGRNSSTTGNSARSGS